MTSPDNIGIELLDVEDLHDQAMDLVEKGISLRKKGDLDGALSAYQKALVLAIASVNELDVEEIEEPSRSVIIRSTGWIAVNAEDYTTAAQMAELGLAGNPPEGIRQELEELRQYVANHQYMVETVKPKADAGDAAAQYEMGIIYYHGKGVVASQKEALEWFQKSAAQGNPEAQLQLGKMYAAGEGVEQSDTAAFEYFQKSADQGNAEAMFQLGLCYLVGKGVLQSGLDALAYILLSAENGNPEAQNYMGLIYYSGIEGVIPQNFELSFSYFEKSANQGHSSSMAILGWMYLSGEGVTKSEHEAFEWLKIGAASNDPFAQFVLAGMYDFGVFVAESKDIAAHWYEQSAIQGNDLAQVILAEKYLEGEGVEQSENEAFEWFHESAEQGNMYAQYELAAIYYSRYSETGDKQLLKDSAIWVTRSAINGYDSAQYNLGMMYYNGEWFEKSEKLAYEWLLKSAEQGNKYAQNQLAHLYYYGLGVEYSIQNALKWYQKSAQNGYELAQCNLGIIYMNGEIAPELIPNSEKTAYELAIEWLQLSAEQGNDRAISLLKLYKEMPHPLNEENLRNPKKDSSKIELEYINWQGMAHVKDSGDSPLNK